jgi:hypothetical protein
LTFTYLEGRVYKPPKKKRTESVIASAVAGAGFPPGVETSNDSLQDVADDSSTRPVKKYKTSTAFTSTTTIIDGLADMNAETEEEISNLPTKKKITPTSLASSGSCDSSFVELPELLLVHVLSFCDVKDINSLMFVSKATFKLSTSDEVWEKPLNDMLKTFFGGVCLMNDGTAGTDGWMGKIFEDWVTPLHERSDWRQSTSILRWILEERELAKEINGSLFISSFVYRHFTSIQHSHHGCFGEVVKNHAVSRLLTVAFKINERLKYLKEHHPESEQKLSNTVDDLIKKRLDLFFTDQPSLRHYYLRLGKVMFLTTEMTLRVETSCYCSHCVRSTMEVPHGFETFPKIFWPLVNLE